MPTHMSASGTSGEELSAHADRADLYAILLSPVAWEQPSLPTPQAPPADAAGLWDQFERREDLYSFWTRGLPRFMHATGTRTDVPGPRSR